MMNPQKWNGRRAATRFLFAATWFSMLAPASGQEAVAFPPATAESQGMSAQALEDLSQVVQGFFDSGTIVGAELLVIKNRRTVLHQVYGWRNLEEELPMEKNSLFNIRSMTKPMTGAALQILVDEGKVELDAAVANYLPGFANDRSREITVRQLLTHRSGLPSMILTGPEEYPDLVSMGNAVGERGPEFEIDSRFWYSDSATDAVGAIVQEVSGMPLDRFMQRRLLNPLAMQDSLYTHHEKDARWQRLASLYIGRPNNWVRFWSPEDGPMYPYAWGAQSLFCTPADYARFLAMCMDDGLVGGKPVLSPQAVHRSLTPVTAMCLPESETPFPTGFPDLKVWYGQLFMLFMRPGEETETPQVAIFGHSGADGTRAWAWPQEDLMVLYCTQSRGQATTLRLEMSMHQLFFGGDDGLADAPKEMQPLIGSYVANYDLYRNVEFQVIYWNGGMALDVPGVMVFPLSPPDEEGKWAFTDFEGLAVSFEKDEKGEVQFMRVHKPGVVHELPKGRAADLKIERPKLKKENVDKFLGFYRDGESGPEIEMVFQDGALAGIIPGVPTPIFFDPPDDQGFRIMQANPQVRIRFDLDAEGHVVSYTAYVPGGTLTRQRIEKESKL